MRTFVAVELPADLRTEVIAYQRRLQSFDAKVRWVKPAQMHITLKFLGEIDETQADLLHELFQVVEKETAPFEVEIQGLGAFPNLRRPSILWVGVTTGIDALAGLAGQVEATAAELGFKKEKRGFNPHLTLGRVKSPKGLPPVMERIQKDESLSFGSFQVSEFVFMQSELKPSGAEYRRLNTYNLR
ncbi:MAG: RNA 2',3'-cyclic phosphodiesterase [Planctomycetota bacterium]|nr:RNA 2',3'-cyclic phosphodiesterase [Planctomycetota bacterium]MDA1137374.1 RNA 2',3'-cyclic phosphodiesterase [Planctomycetota bacterium]